MWSGIGRSARAALAGVACMAACVTVACGPLIGIDDGLPNDDAATSPPDAFALDVALDMALDVAPGDASSNTMQSPPAEGGPIVTPSDGALEVDSDGPCMSDPNWCSDRCGPTTDNCGAPVDCVPCEAGVRCGVDASTGCALNQVCLTDGGTCCTPDNVTACGNRCQVPATNNCGVAIECPGCPSGQACQGGLCCKPTGCGGSCVDNCGQSNQACCPTAPPDSGATPPPADSGACIAMGNACNGNSVCCSGACSSAGTCVSSCGILDVKCNNTSTCCYFLTCRPLIQPQSLTIPESTSVVVQPGQCEP